MNLVIDVSVLIDNFFVYDEEQSNRARSLFKLVTDKDLILIPGMFPHVVTKTQRTVNASSNDGFVYISAIT